MTDEGRPQLRQPQRPQTALMVAALRAIALTAAVALPIAALVAGRPGLVGAAAGVGLMLVLFGASTVSFALAAPHGWNAFMLTMLGGLVVRLVLYFLALRAMSGIEALDGTSLALTAVFGIVVGQVLEMRALSKSPGRVAPPRATDLEGADR